MQCNWFYFLENLENTSQTLYTTSVQPVTCPTENMECQGSNCPSAGGPRGTQLQVSLYSVLLVGLLSLCVLYWGKTRPSRDTSCISFMYTQIGSSHIEKKQSLILFIKLSAADIYWSITFDESGTFTELKVIIFMFLLEKIQNFLCLLIQDDRTSIPVINGVNLPWKRQLKSVWRICWYIACILKYRYMFWFSYCTRRVYHLILYFKEKTFFLY